MHLTGYIWTRGTLLAVAALIGMTSSIANAGAREDAAVKAYDAYCIQGVLRPRHLQETLRKANATPSTPIASAEFLKQAGQVWRVKSERGFLRVFLSATGACGVMFQQIDYPTLVSVFERRVSALFIEKEDDETQTLNSYAVNAPTANEEEESRVLALLLGGKVGYSRATGEVVLSAIPKTVFDKAGVKIAWPAQ
jgi:hypothetical protein